jgi:signal transduction histidine kinase
VRKHAQTDQATIRLSQQEDHIRISIEDQGEGFNLEEMLEKGNSFGLKIIQERAERIGSSLKINSIPGEGTTIILYYSLGNEK